MNHKNNEKMDKSINEFLQDSNSMEYVASMINLLSKKDHTGINQSVRFIDDHDCPIENELNVGQTYRLINVETGQFENEIIARNNTLASEKIAKKVLFSNKTLTLPAYHKFYICNTTDGTIGKIYGYDAVLRMMNYQGSMIKNLNIDHLKKIPKSLIKKVNDANKIV